MVQRVKRRERRLRQAEVMLQVLSDVLGRTAAVLLRVNEKVESLIQKLEAREPNS